MYRSPHQPFTSPLPFSISRLSSLPLSTLAMKAPEAKGNTFGIRDDRSKQPPPPPNRPASTIERSPASSPYSLTHDGNSRQRTIHRRCNLYDDVTDEYDAEPNATDVG